MPSVETLLENVIEELFSPMYQLAVVLTVLYFLYGVARYVIDLNTSNVDRQAAGRRHLLWGMVGLFIVLSVGGIFSFMDDTLGGFYK